MCLRWTASGMLQAEQQFRKIIGYSDLAKLAKAVGDLTARRVTVQTTTEEETTTTHYSKTALELRATDALFF
jgi:putative transposase